MNGNNDNRVSVEGTRQQLGQLFMRIAQETSQVNPSNPVHFFADFLCRNYPEHLHGFGDLWNDDPQCEFEKELVLDFFRFNKIPSDVAASFLQLGFDTLESIMTLTAEDVANEPAFQNWLPGHKVRVRQLFETIHDRVKTFRHEREAFFRVRPMESSFLPAHVGNLVSKSLTHHSQQQQQLTQHQHLSPMPTMSPPRIPTHQAALINDPNQPQPVINGGGSVLISPNGQIISPARVGMEVTSHHLKSGSNNGILIGNPSNALNNTNVILRSAPLQHAPNSATISSSQAMTNIPPINIMQQDHHSPPVPRMNLISPPSSNLIPQSQSVANPNSLYGGSLINHVNVAQPSVINQQQQGVTAQHHYQSE